MGRSSPVKSPDAVAARAAAVAAAVKRAAVVPEGMQASIDKCVKKYKSKEFLSQKEFLAKFFKHESFRFIEHKTSDGAVLRADNNYKAYLKLCFPQLALRDHYTSSRPDSRRAKAETPVQVIVIEDSEDEGEPGVFGDVSFDDFTLQLVADQHVPEFVLEDVQVTHAEAADIGDLSFLECMTEEASFDAVFATKTIQMLGEADDPLWGILDAHDY